MRAKSASQGPRYSRILLEDNYIILMHSFPFSTFVNSGRRHPTRAAGWPETTTPQTSKALESRSEFRSLNGVQATFPSALRMVRLEASRSFSKGSQLFLPPVPAPSDRLRRAPSLLRRV